MGAMEGRSHLAPHVVWSLAPAWLVVVVTGPLCPALGLVLALTQKTTSPPTTQCVQRSPSPSCPEASPLSSLLSFLFYQQIKRGPSTAENNPRAVLGGSLGPVAWRMRGDSQHWSGRAGAPAGKIRQVFL